MKVRPGTPITLREAARRYDLQHGTLGRWARRGLVVVLSQSSGRGFACVLDEASVESIARVYHLDPGRGKRTALLNVIDADQLRLE